jgi:hypothetical protein
MTRLTSMIGDAWNIIGLNKSGKISCVADLISKYRLDFIGIQETKKAIIDDRTMKNISKYMDCNFLPADGTIGGILVGFKSNVFEIFS